MQLEREGERVVPRPLSQCRPHRGCIDIATTPACSFAGYYKSDCVKRSGILVLSKSQKSLGGVSGRHPYLGPGLFGYHLPATSVDVVDGVSFHHGCKSRVHVTQRDSSHMHCTIIVRLCTGKTTPSLNQFIEAVVISLRRDSLWNKISHDFSLC